MVTNFEKPTRILLAARRFGIIDSHVSSHIGCTAVSPLVCRVTVTRAREEQQRGFHVVTTGGQAIGFLCLMRIISCVRPYRLFLHFLIRRIPEFEVPD